MEIKALAIEEGNKEVLGVVKVDGWKNVSQMLVENKLVMLEVPDKIVIAKCMALGASGIIVSNDDKIQVSITKVVLDEMNWNKLLELEVNEGKVWVDEANLKLVINK